MTYPADQLQAERTAASPMEILTPKQLAERLQVKPSWVYEQTRYRADVRNADPLPFIKMGRYIRFDWRDVLAWLERQKNAKRTETGQTPETRHRATMSFAVAA